MGSFNQFRKLLSCLTMCRLKACASIMLSVMVTVLQNCQFQSTLSWFCVWCQLNALRLVLLMPFMLLASSWCEVSAATLSTWCLQWWRACFSAVKRPWLLSARYDGLPFPCVLTTTMQVTKVCTALHEHSTISRKNMWPFLGQWSVWHTGLVYPWTISRIHSSYCQNVIPRPIVAVNFWWPKLWSTLVCPLQNTWWHVFYRLQPEIKSFHYNIPRNSLLEYYYYIIV